MVGMVMHSDETRFGDIITTSITGNVYFITDEQKDSGKWCILMKEVEIGRKLFIDKNGLYGVSCSIKNKKKATTSDLLLATTKCNNEEVREQLKKLLKERL